MIGKTVTHYEIQSQLGAGGMGVVYKAKDLRLDRLVALKFLPPQFASTEALKRRFVNEARAASALDHINICTIHEIDESEDGQLFIVMALYQGESLQERIRRGPLSPAETLDIGIQVTEGLSAAHERGILHRDIKPGNIFITDRQTVKVLDFGLAKVSGATKITRSGTSMGTLSYMPPEQLRGEDADPRSDLFSLGAVLYEMLVGEPAFGGDNEGAVLNRVLNQEPAPPSSRRPGIAPGFDRLVGRALAKDPDHRYPTAVDLRSDLEALQVEAADSDDQPTLLEIPEEPTPVVTTDLSPGLNTIAVLEFTNVSGDSEAEWLSGGIAESVTADLKKVGSLRVVDRRRVMQTLASVPNGMAGDEDLASAGRSLGSRWLVSGSFQKMGDRLRVTAQCLDVASQAVKASIKLDGTMQEIFSLQDQIITAMMEALGVRISESEALEIERPETLDLEAYEYCAKARQLIYRMGKEDLELARQFLEKALALDPDYAMAHYFLGVSLWLRAILDHQTEGYEEATRHLRRTTEVLPKYQSAYQVLADICSRRGEYEEAERYLKTAMQIEESGEFDMARFVGSLAHMGQLALRRGDLDAAEELYLRQLKLIEATDHVYSPSYGAMTLCFLGDIAERRHQHDSALDHFRQAASQISTTPRSLGIGWVEIRARLGRARLFRSLDMRREEDQSLQQALALFQGREGYDFSGLFLHGDGEFWADLAAYQVSASRSKDALASLEKAVECGWLETARLKWDPDLRQLQSDSEAHTRIEKILARRQETGRPNHPPPVYELFGESRKGGETTPARDATRPLKGIEAPPRSASRPRHWLMVIAAVAVLVVCGIAARRWIRDRHEATETSETAVVRSGEASEPAAKLVARRVLVAPFENRTGDPSLSSLGLMASDWITRGLAQTGLVEAVSPITAVSSARFVAQEAGATDERERIAALAAETGAGTVVTGAIYRQGEEILIAAQVTDTITMHLLGALEPSRAPVGEPLVAVENLQSRIMASVATRLDSRLASLARPSDLPNYEAYNEYSQGLERFILLDFRGAANRWTRANAMDSSFIRPLLLAAMAYLNLSEWEMAYGLVQKVVPHRSSLSVLDQLLLDRLVSTFEQDFEGALAAMRRSAELNPQGPGAFDAGALALITNRPREAVERLEAIDFERGFYRGFAPYWHFLTEAYHLLGDHAEEIERARRARELYPSNLSAVWWEARARVALGDFETVRDLIGVDPGHGVFDKTAGSVRIASAGELEAHGYPEEAVEIAEAAVEWYNVRLETEGADRVARAGRAEALFAAGRWKEAEEEFVKLAADDPDDLTTSGYLGLLAAGRGDSVTAQEVSSWFEQLDRPYLWGAPYYWRAAIAAWSGDMDRALQLFRDSAAHGRALAGAVPPPHSDLVLQPLWDYPAFQKFIEPRG
ncbi:MAG: protein kinase [Thermoanaerobaculia bacterium]